MFNKLTRAICLGMCVLLLGCAHDAAQVRHDSSTRPANVPILLYHHIDDLAVGASAARRRWTISPKRFEAQMDWVAARGFHTITIEQLSRHLKYGDVLPHQPIVITFDDGWRDHYSVALPILLKHGFVGTFFIISDSVGHSVYMDWDQIKALAKAGMDIQSHTVTHPNLSVLPVGQVRREIINSKKTIEDHLHKPVTVLAYPFGKYDDAVITAAREAGMEGAVTVSGMNGGYILRSDRTYTLDRYAVENGETLEDIFKAKGVAVQ